MNNQSTNQPTNEMKVPEGYKLVKIGRTESQKKAQAKYEAKNKEARNEKRRINNNLRYANDPDYRENKKNYYKKINPFDLIKI